MSCFSPSLFLPYMVFFVIILGARGDMEAARFYLFFSLLQRARLTFRTEQLLE